jgi:hypothetical protein
MLWNLCTLEHTLQIASAASAALAAWSWLLASLVKLPAQTTLDNLDNVYPLMRRQSSLNAQAAFFAAIAALLQLPQAFMPTCWS